MVLQGNIQIKRVWSVWKSDSNVRLPICIILKQKITICFTKDSKWDFQIHYTLMQITKYLDESVTGSTDMPRIGTK